MVSEIHTHDRLKNKQTAHSGCARHSRRQLGNKKVHCVKKEVAYNVPYTQYLFGLFSCAVPKDDPPEVEAQKTHFTCFDASFMDLSRYTNKCVALPPSFHGLCVASQASNLLD